MGWPCIFLVGWVAVEIDKELFKRLFPHLARELELGEHRVAITSVRSDVEVGERAASHRFTGYMPDVIDFLRRCDDEAQGEEIISYLERRGEISHEYAERLRKQLREKGIRSFGPKKEDGYYFKHGGL